MKYSLRLKRIRRPRPLLADYPQYLEPLKTENRFESPPLVNDRNGRLQLRSWRYWYNARGIVEMENRLDPRATAIVMVHPWGIDDGVGLKTSEPAGVAFQCTKEKNALTLRHMREVIDPFLKRWRPRVQAVGYSLPGEEDRIRRLMYASASTPVEALRIEEGHRQLARLLKKYPFRGRPLVRTLELDDVRTVRSYLDQTPSTDSGEHYCGRGFWSLPMPISSGIDYIPGDVVFYDSEGYFKVRDFLKTRGVRHVLLIGYCTDMCVARTTCGYQNLSKDFNVFIVGDVTMATFPGSTTPRYATQVALANAALTQMITQASWVRMKA
jgi:hypothetical protein